MAEQSDKPQGGSERDLSFLWPLIDRVKAVEIKFAPDDAGVNNPASDAAKTDAEARIKVLEDEVAALKQLLQSTVGTLRDGIDAAAAAVAEAAIELPPQRWSRVVICAAVTVLSLLAAHWLIVFVYDKPTLLLRLVSIAIPLPLAVGLTLRHRITPSIEIAYGFLVGAIAVFGMAYVTSLHEKTGFLPENMREWQETLEYTASIMFAHLTGVLVSSALQARSGAQNRTGAATLRLAQVIAFVTGRAIARGPELKKHVDTVQTVVSNLMPVASAIMAIVTGIRGILN